MINILLNASVTGGIVVLLWYLSYPLSKKYFKASWHYAVLKITMVFMLIPISVLAPMFNNVLAGLFSQPEIPNISGQIQKINIDAETINSVNSALSSFVFPEVQPSQPLSQPENVVEQPSSIENTDNVNDDIKTTTPDIPYLQIIWLIVAVLLFNGGIRKMHRFKKQILNNSSSNVDSETEELFLQCKEQLGVRGRINLRTSEYIRTPFVFGLMKPFVIFPETGMSADEKRLAFTHELTHIKNGDLWLKVISSVISAVHWFNPLAHLLSRKISVISEEYCDECVIKTMTKEERLLYGSLILKVFSDMIAPKVQLSKFCSTLSAPTKNIKRRLSNMMNFKKSRKSMIVFSLIAALVICSLATVYAFAASTDTEITGKILEEITISVNNTINNETNETITTQVGEIDIITPEGQEPILNENGTITLPGGGEYILPSGDKITVSSGAVIRSDGVVPGAPVDKGKLLTGDFLNSGRKITVEQVNGDIICVEEDGTILINSKKLSEINNSLEILSILSNYLSYNGYALIGDRFTDDSGFEYSSDWERFKENYDLPKDFKFDIDWDYFGTDSAWENYINFDNWYGTGIWLNPDGTITFEESWLEGMESMGMLDGFLQGISNDNNLLTAFLYDSSKIQAKTSYFLKIYTDNGVGTIKMSGKSTIELPNGIIINAPANTVISGSKADNTLEISIGSGDATITQANGTSSIVPAGTVLDGEGNIIIEK